MFNLIFLFGFEKKLQKNFLVLLTLFWVYTNILYKEYSAKRKVFYEDWL